MCHTIKQRYCHMSVCFPLFPAFNFREKPHIVYLQEVVPQTFEILQRKCGRYRCIVGRLSSSEEMLEGEYFVVILLQKDAVKYTSHEVLRFHSSQMDRVLLKVQVFLCMISDFCKSLKVKLAVLFFSNRRFRHASSCLWNHHPACFKQHLFWDSVFSTFTSFLSSVHCQCSHFYSPPLFHFSLKTYFFHRPTIIFLTFLSHCLYRFFVDILIVGTAFVW